MTTTTAHFPTTLLPVLTLTLLLSLHLPVSTTSAQTTPAPTQQPVPETASEGYDTLVPQAVRTDRQTKEILGQIQTLQTEIDQTRQSIPDKTTVTTLQNQTKQILANQLALSQAIDALRNEINKINLFLNSYGHGYEAGRATGYSKQPGQQSATHLQYPPRPIDPLNP
jgi:TolA-binding protein